jgi:predicted enzyme related to lactoylglutathione lyase
MKPILRFAPLSIAAALLAAVIPVSVHAAKFPPLNAPATAEHIPGKLVWADLFTADPDGATKFYCGLFDWTAASLEQKGNGYVVFSDGGTPVAGLSPRTVKGSNHPSRWIGYFAVTDIAATLAAATKDGGTVRAPSRNFPDRGYQAIFSDPDGIPIGLLQSTSGDTPDNQTKTGAWNWFEFYAKNPKAASREPRQDTGKGSVPRGRGPARAALRRIWKPLCDNPRFHRRHTRPRRIHRHCKSRQQPMKHTRKILLLSLMLVGMPFVWNGCVGYVGGGGGGGYYGPSGVWFQDDVWVDGGGRGWYGGHGGGGGVHPGGGGRR